MSKTVCRQRSPFFRQLDWIVFFLFLFILVAVATTAIVIVTKKEGDDRQGNVGITITHGKREIPEEVSAGSSILKKEDVPLRDISGKKPKKLKASGSKNPKNSRRTFVAEHSVEGRPIKVVEMGTGKDVTLILGAFHGDEPVTTCLVRRLEAHLKRNDELLLQRRVVLVPAVNPDGLVRQTRGNAHGVDLNRNFPTKNWRPKYKAKRYYPGLSPSSEPETKAVIDLVTQYHPDKIISIHAPLHNVNYDGPGKTLAQEMAAHNQYPIKEYIGYATPGSFGTYAGKERGYPTITLELPNVSCSTAWEQNKGALIAAIQYEVDSVAKNRR